MKKLFNFLIFTFFEFVVIDSATRLGEIIGFPDMPYVAISILLGAAMMHIIELEDKKKDKDD